MRFSVLHSLALGLPGLNIAVASVCKPRSPGHSSSVAQTTTNEISSLTSSSATFASTTTEVITTDTTEATTVVTTTASADDTSTIENSVAPDPTSVSSDVVTTTSITTTSIPSSTDIPLFRLIAQGGPADSQTLLADRTGFATLLFTQGAGDFTDAYFAVDPVTHYLLLDNEQPICGYFGDADGFATLSICSSSPSLEEVKITCEAPTGTYLQCSVAALDCSGQCVATGETWSATYTGEWGFPIRYNARLGPDSVEGVSQTPFLIEFDS
ncbi:hypothetical protein FHETE_8903 [Fusarium heterosporum]|uniref:Uncharacterized protein n=1 Tax=Fusarium heterosporum TaxID=42747 RepID=A0A8H5T0F5_FUSHE|nr:hypothetical protein FHETE_8903 [Fusarium heterosporum]